MDRIRANLEKLKGCAENEHCEETECAYFLPLDDLMELIAFVEEVLEERETE